MSLSKENVAAAGRDEAASGVFNAVLAFGWWGVMPLFFKETVHIPPLEVLSHRVVWSLVFVMLLLSWGRRWGKLKSAVASKGNLKTFLASTVLIAVNWLTFIWGVSQSQVLQISLGYYINPLVNVLLGMLFLQERLNRWQTLAVAMAAVGVAILTVQGDSFPWISLTLAFSFGVYGLLRKTAKVESLVGLTLETALLTPLAIAYIAFLGVRGAGLFLESSSWDHLLLFALGPVTALPLIWFANGARRLKLSTIGLLQYIAPSGHILLAVFVWGEPFTTVHMITFALIWGGLFLYSWDSFRRRPRGV